MHDERHIMFLSMVDVPGGGPLRLTQTDATKQRYNVAASRARDQMWLIHSLDPSRDLKPEDLRRRLVEFVRDPNAKRREIDKATRRAESPFEKAVMERLVATGYKIEPQVQVGGYRIDIVVSDGLRQAALECDGDRFHGMDQIADDMARQAVLERAGWRFVRLRGTRFYRDQDAAMSWVSAELARLDIRPSAATPTDVNAETVAFRESVVRRVWEIMRGQGWLPPQSTDGQPEDRQRPG